MAKKGPSLRYPSGTTVAPGDRLGNARQISSGPGTYTRGTHVYACTVGTLTIEEKETSSIVTVVPEGKRTYAIHQILSVNQLVLCRVLRIGPQQATVDILYAEGPAGTLKDPRGGMIRKENVRSGPTEDVEIYASFRPGDVVRARIISLGDSRRYYLSTAENELGVVRAKCEKSGKDMVIVSWKEMECEKSGVRELRKCAKPMEG